MAWDDSSHPRDNLGRFVTVVRASEPKYGGGADYMGMASAGQHDKIPDYTRTTEKMDDAAEGLFRQRDPDTGRRLSKDEQWAYLEDNLPNTDGPAFEAARQIRLVTALEESGQSYDSWAEVPEYITVYRGDSRDRGVGDTYENFSLRREVSEQFAGAGGPVREYVVHKDDILWTNQNYLGHAESEVIVGQPARRTFERGEGGELRTPRSYHQRIDEEDVGEDEDEDEWATGSEND